MTGYRLPVPPGFASMTVPVYVAESAPAEIRGRLVTLNQLFITIGVLLSSIIAGVFSDMKDTGWRYGVDSVTMAYSVTVCVCWRGGDVEPVLHHHRRPFQHHCWGFQ